jgi:hypothetical protein
MKTPYLIQRCEILKPLAATGDRLSRAVNMDYMGSAEFEFGALPKSFRRMQAGTLVLRLFEDIKENDVPLRVMSTMNVSDFAEYGKHLMRLRGDDRMRLKEWSDFNPNLRSRYGKTDFWWDVENDVMWSFHKPFMNRLEEHLKASFAYMDDAAAK